MRCILEKEGYEVLSGETIQKGLDIADKQQPDLIILDVMVEEFDAGLSFYIDLHRKNPRAPIIFLTSLGQQVLPFFPASGSTVGVLEKPVDSSALLAAVRARIDTASGE